MSPPDAASSALIVAGERARELRARLARDDANVFSRFVLRDARNAQPFDQAPMHREWHRLLDKERRLLIWSHFEAGKTSQISVGRVLFELGNDPSLRVAIGSKTERHAKKIVGTLEQYIETSRELREVFPGLRPAEDKRLPWSATALTVARPVTSPDPSVQAFSLFGSIVGSRIDLLILDDILDAVNTGTAGQRDAVHDWVLTIFGRLTDNARVWILGNAWHPDDAMHRLAKHMHWTARRFPVIDGGGRITWPARWTPARIEQARKDFSNPAEYARQMLCVARDNSTSRFKREYLQVALEAGDRPGWRPVRILKSLPTGYRTFTGVDLGARIHERADLTVLFTLLVYPDDRVEVLNVESGRWQGPEVVRRIVAVQHRYMSIVAVESNAAQEYLAQFTAAEGIPVQAYNTTGQRKRDPQFGLEAMATEMANGRWIVPNVGGQSTPEVQAWLQELLLDDPTAHTGDRLMASWIAREASRGRAKPVVLRVRKMDTLTR